MADARSDARVDALLRRLDVPAAPRDEFVRASVAAVLPLARRSRAQDGRRLGRLLRDLRLPVTRGWLAAGRRTAVAGMTLVIVALLLAAMVIFLVGSRRHVPPPFGPAANGRIAYIADGQVFTADPFGADRRQITFDVGRDEDPVFSRDGTRLAFRHFLPNESVPAAIDAVVSDLDGSHRIVIAQAVINLGHIAWSPDGAFVAFSGSIGGGPDRGWIAPSDGSEPPTMFASMKGAWDPVWSPDGVRLAIGGDPGLLYVIDRDGGHSHVVNQGRYTEIGQRGEVAAWSPDGTRILFTAIDLDDKQHVYIVDLDGTPERRLTFDVNTEREAVWSPDGTKIAYMRLGTGDGPVVVITDPTGKLFHKLPGAYGWYEPVWSPDGTKLIVTDDRPGPYNKTGPAIRAILDAVGNAPRIEIPAPGTTPDEVPDWAASWQRVAP
jgi:Tol biopolymer transport system component